jgi:hypothetical protein
VGDSSFNALLCKSPYGTFRHERDDGARDDDPDTGWHGRRKGRHGLISAAGALAIGKQILAGRA